MPGEATGPGAAAGCTERVEPGKGMLAAGNPNNVRPTGPAAGRGGTDEGVIGAALPSVRDGDAPGRVGGIAPARTPGISDGRMPPVGTLGTAGARRAGIEVAV